MAERAVAMAREAPEDPWCGLAAPERAGARLGPRRARSRRPRAAPAPRRCRRRRSRPRRRRWRCPGSASMDAAGAGWQPSRVHLAASNGFSGGYARTGALAAGGGDLRRGPRHGARLRLREPQPRRRPARRPTRSGGWRASARWRAPAPASRRPAPSRCSSTSGWPASLIGHLVQAVNGARDRPRRQLAQGRARRAGAAGRDRPGRGPAAPAHLGLAAVRRRGAAGRAPRAGGGRRAARAGPSISPPRGSSG